MRIHSETKLQLRRNPAAVRTYPCELSTENDHWRWGEGGSGSVSDWTARHGAGGGISANHRIGFEYGGAARIANSTLPCHPLPFPAPLLPQALPVFTTLPLIFKPFTPIASFLLLSPDAALSVAVARRSQTPKRPTITHCAFVFLNSHTTSTWLETGLQH